MVKRKGKGEITEKGTHFYSRKVNVWKKKKRENETNKETDKDERKEEEGESEKRKHRKKRRNIKNKQGSRRIRIRTSK